MTTLFTALHGAESVLLTVARLWAMAGELITAGALLLALDRLAAAIRTTYQAGRLVGRVLWPVIYWLAAVCRLIDWRLVAAVVIDGLKILVAATITAAQLAIPTLTKVSAAMGRWYAAVLVKPAAVAVVPVLPVVHPLAVMAEDLEGLTCNQLRALIGTRKRVRKAELIAMACVV
jgi:hypothetical protein